MIASAAQTDFADRRYAPAQLMGSESPGRNTLNALA
jgi:hypothetical protein